MNLKIPATWNKEELSELIKISEDSKFSKIVEVYGSVPMSKIRSGRPFSDLKDVNLNQVKEYFDFCKSNKIKTNYLFNGIYSDSEINYELIGKIKNIIELTSPDKVTITSLKLMREFSNLFPDTLIGVSTIVGVKNYQDLMKLKLLKEQGINLESICLHHDCTLDRNLQEFISVLDKEGFKNEILVNENCEYDCQFRKKHYEGFTSKESSKSSDYCLLTCIRNLLIDPSKLLGLAGCIRPEDTLFFENIGINVFKIAGRNKPYAWLKNVVNAYSNKKYDRNLIDLLVFTLPGDKKAVDLFYIKNSEITPINDRWTKTPVKDMVDESNKLFLDENLIINDGLYTINEKIINIKQGYYLNYILEQLKN